MTEALMSFPAACEAFVAATLTQSAAHITPLHWHLATRLALEGGFEPDWITPRPPFRLERTGRGRHRTNHLILDESAAVPGERTVLGGLKTKDVDVVVVVPGVGPCMAISVKGTLNAFRNLTNRMEEAAGDCTNLHMAYPALVYGFLHILRANLQQDGAERNDIAVFADGSIADTILRYHDAMSRIAGRRDLRNDFTRYEAVALAALSMLPLTRGVPMPAFPPPESPLRIEKFLPQLFADYDLRYVYSAPALRDQTERRVWTVDAPLVQAASTYGFDVRIA